MQANSCPLRTRRILFSTLQLLNDPVRYTLCPPCVQQKTHGISSSLSCTATAVSVSFEVREGVVGTPAGMERQTEESKKESYTNQYGSPDNSTGYDYGASSENLYIVTRNSLTTIKMQKIRPFSPYPGKFVLFYR